MLKWFCICISVLAVGAFWPLFFQPAQGDMGVYVYIGEGMTHGYVPYKDAWDIKSPGIFLQDATALATFGHHTEGIFVFEIAFVIGTCIACYVAARKIAGEGAGLLAGIALFAGYESFGFGGWGYQPETPAMLISAMLLCVALGEGRLPNGTSVLAGVAAAVLFWYKLPFVILALVLIPRVFAKDSRASLLKSSALAICGFAGVSALVFAYFGLNHAMKDFYEGAFSMASRMVASYGLPFGERVSELLNSFVFLWGLIWSVMVGSIAGAIARLSEKARAKQTLWLFLGLAVLVVFWQGRYLPYHWLVALPPLAILAGIGGADIANWLRKVVPWSWARLSLVGLGLMATSMLMPLNVWGDYLGTSTRDEFWERLASNYGQDGRITRANVLPQIARDLAEQTPANGTILGFDLDPQVNFYSGRRAPTRFLYVWPVEHKPFADMGYGAEYVRSIEAARPKFIVLTRANRRGVPQVRQPDGTLKTMPTDDLERLKKWPELGEWFLKNYSLYDTRQSLEVYKLNEP